MNTITVMNNTNASRLRGNMRPMVNTMSEHENPKCRFTLRCRTQCVTKGNNKKNSRENSMSANTYT